VLLLGLGLDRHFSTHFAAIEMAKVSVVPSEGAETGHIFVFGVDIHARLVAGHVGHKRELVESALLLVVNQALYGRSRRD
jgi:hypothetical protein